MTKFVGVTVAVAVQEIIAASVIPIHEVHRVSYAADLRRRGVTLTMKRGRVGLGQRRRYYSLQITARS